MNLDKLRKLIDTYNPASSQRTAESVDAHHKLALLAHSYLLPALEVVVASDECVMIENHDECKRCAVLAKLEDALK